MATWTHFTSYLNGTRGIRKEERDELFDNFAALLTTSGCSAAGYSLDSTDTTAIKASSFITDLVSLDGPSISNQRQHLQSAAAAASTAFGNYASAVSTALAGEGLTSTQRDAILTSRINDYRLWNYYKRLIDALTCSASISVVEYRSRGASKTKCGHTEFGTPSSPPKRYLTKTVSGLITQRQYAIPPDYCAGACNYRQDITWSGKCEYDTNCGTPSNTMQYVAVDDTNGDCAVDTPYPPTPIACSATTVGITGDDASYVETETLFQVSHGGTCDPGSYNAWSGSASISLSNEYSTGFLETVVDTAAGSASWSAWSTSAFGAFRVTSPDEMTMTVTQVEFRVTFTTPVPAGMKLKWNLRLNGSIIAANCISLSTGVSSFTDSLPHPAGFDGTYSVSDFVLASSC